MGKLRLLLALAVVAAHYGPVFGTKLVGGEVAVKSFFMISGFYMSLVLNEKYVKEKSSYALFISNRFLRLYPIYWVILLMTALYSVFQVFYTGGANAGRMNIAYEYITSGRPLDQFSIVFLMLANIFLFGQDVVMFLGLNTETGQFFFTKDFAQTNPELYQFLFIPQAWTIGLELMFYLIAPFVLRSYKRVLLLFALSLLAKVLLQLFGLTHDPWSYRFFPAELMFFLAGYFAYLVYKKYEKAKLPAHNLSALLIFICLFTVLYSRLRFIPYLSTIYFISFFLSLPFIFIKTKKDRLDYKIGDLSYPVYISHIFVGGILQRLLPAEQGQFMGTSLYVMPASIVLAFLLNKLVSVPLEKIRQRRVASKGMSISNAPGKGNLV